MRNRYQWWLFTSEYCLCTNLHLQEQSMNMMSQCQINNAKSEKTVLSMLSDNSKMSDWWLFWAEFYVQNIKWHVRNKIMHLLLWIMIFWSLVMQFANDFQEWSHEWESFANHPTCNQKIISHGKICYILYISTIWLNILVKCNLFIELGSWSSLSHPSILGVTLCFCTGSYAAAAAAAGRRFLSTR